MSITASNLPLFAVSLPGPEVLTPVAIFFAISAGVWWLISTFGGGNEPTVENRLEEMRNPRSRTVATTAADDKAKKKSEALAAVLERATSPLASTVKGTDAQMSKLRERMLHAGFRREQAPIVFKGGQLILGGIGLFLGGIVGVVMDGLTTQLAVKALIAGGIGFYLPEIVLWAMARKRKEAIFLGLPDALDLMVVCVEAGLGLDQALRKVGEEMKKSHKVIADEYNVANQQLQFGRSRAEVLHALGYRSGVDDLKQLASILIQADKFGSSVGQALRVQSDAMRVKRRQIAEEKAAKTAVKMIFPLVLFIFPGIFVVLVGPAAINMYRNLLTM
ncbi:MAG: type II secretion system F family protein [Planctomycetaceae bacterium]